MGYKNKSNKQYQRTEDEKQQKKKEYYEKNTEKILQYNEAYIKRNLRYE